jgi:hypothetical protein
LCGDKESGRLIRNALDFLSNAISVHMFAIQIVKTIVLVGFLVGASACTIVSYGPEVIAPDASVKKEGIVRFFYYTGTARDPNAKENPLPVEARLLQEILGRICSSYCIDSSTDKRNSSQHLRNLQRTIRRDQMVL